MTPRLAFSFALLVVFGSFASSAPQDGLGYQDTPIVRGYHVHDGTRPQPTHVTPGTMPAQQRLQEPPSDATVLFDGTSLDAWRGSKGEAGWKIVVPEAVESLLTDKWMEVVRGTGTISTKEEFGDCQLHLEWRTPVTSKGKGQGRSNSGVFFCGRYEIQVLDSFENRTYPDGQAAAMYGQWPPRVNASRPAGQWQSYDIVFEAPRYNADGDLASPAFATVFHNGICVHNRQAFDGPTGHKRAAAYGKAPRGTTDGIERGPLSLQDHGDPVAFRNIWIRPLHTYDEGRAVGAGKDGDK
ncbi:MAG: DUF1080 domain-containing protein [Planctomycetes bacterium]|nr:DUF1080 domain-containing protein [Planctomycetota bacterium]MCB9917943.1 DUF1080 domain-containing protein [Planctomycetota bacterium]